MPKRSARTVDPVVPTIIRDTSSYRTYGTAPFPGMPAFIVANPQTHRAQLIELNIEYVSWVLAGIEHAFGVPNGQVLGMSASEYVPAVIDEICGGRPPAGVFYVVHVDGEAAGMGGLRALDAGVAEIKRVYVRQAFRGMKLGDRIVKRLVEDATRFGYRRLCLDTAPFMKAAHQLYESNGFADCSAYEGVEVPPEFRKDWRCMDRWI